MNYFQIKIVVRTNYSEGNFIEINSPLNFPYSMKYKSLLFLGLFLVAACKPGSFNGESVARRIYPERVASMYIRSQHVQTDTAYSLGYKLSAHQSQRFTEAWNSSTSIGLCKYYPSYWVTVILTDSSRRTFRLSKKSIKENNDYCFQVDDSTFIERLWEDVQSNTNN